MTLTKVIVFGNELALASPRAQELIEELKVHEEIEIVVASQPSGVRKRPGDDSESYDWAILVVRGTQPPHLQPWIQQFKMFKKPPKFAALVEKLLPSTASWEMHPDPILLPIDHLDLLIRRILGSTLGKTQLFEGKAQVHFPNEAGASDQTVKFSLAQAPTQVDMKAPAELQDIVEPLKLDLESDASDELSMSVARQPAHKVSLPPPPVMDYDKTKLQLDNDLMLESAVAQAMKGEVTNSQISVPEGITFLQADDSQTNDSVAPLESEATEVNDLQYPDLQVSGQEEALSLNHDDVNVEPSIDADAFLEQKQDEASSTSQEINLSSDELLNAFDDPATERAAVNQVDPHAETVMDNEAFGAELPFEQDDESLKLGAHLELPTLKEDSSVNFVAGGPASNTRSGVVAGPKIPAKVVNSSGDTKTSISLSQFASAESGLDQKIEGLSDIKLKLTGNESLDLETIKKYAAFKEREVREKENSIEILNRQMVQVQEKLNRSDDERRRLSLQNEELMVNNRSLDDFKAQHMFHMKKTETQYAEENKAMQLRLDNAQFQANRAEKKLNEFRERVRADILKIRLRERELANKLELQKRDAEALLHAKDERLLQQKREIDKLEFELQNLKERFMEETERGEERASKLARALHSLKMAQGVLSGIDEEVMPAARDGSDPMDGAGEGEAA